MLVVVGILGVLFALIALAISAVSLKRELQKPKKEKIAELKREMQEAAAGEFEGEIKKKGS